MTGEIELLQALNNDSKNYIKIFQLYNEFKKNNPDETVIKTLIQLNEEFFNNPEKYIYALFKNDQEANKKIQEILTQEKNTPHQNISTIRKLFSLFSDEDFSGFLNLIHFELSNDNNQNSSQQLLFTLCDFYQNEITRLNTVIHEKYNEIENIQFDNGNYLSIFKKMSKIREAMLELQSLEVGLCVTKEKSLFHEFTQKIPFDDLENKIIEAALSDSEMKSSIDQIQKSLESNSLEIYSAIKNFIGLVQKSIPLNYDEAYLLIKTIFKDIENDKAVLSYLYDKLSIFYDANVEEHLNTLLADLCDEKAHPLTAVLTYDKLKERVQHLLRRNSQGKTTLREAEFDTVMNVILSERDGELKHNIVIKKLCENILSDVPLYDAFNALLNALRNVSQQPITVPFAINHFFSRLNKLFQDLKGEDDKTDPNVRVLVIKLLSKHYKISLDNQDIKNMIDIKEGLQNFSSFCFNQKKDYPIFQVYDDLLNNTDDDPFLTKQRMDSIKKLIPKFEYGGQVIDEFKALGSPLDWIGNLVTFEGQDNSLLDDWGIPDKLYSNSTPNYQVAFNYLNANIFIKNYHHEKYQLEKFINEDELIKWALQVVDQICRYFVSHGHMEMFLHHQHQAAEDLIILIKGNLFARNLPVVERYANIIRALKSIKKSQEYLFKIAQESLEDESIASFSREIEEPRAPLHQALKINSIKSKKTDDDITNALERRPVDIIMQLRREYKEAQLESRQARNIKRRHTDISKPALLNELQKHTQYLTYFLNWFKNLIKNEVRETLDAHFERKAPLSFSHLFTKKRKTLPIKRTDELSLEGMYTSITVTT